MTEVARRERKVQRRAARPPRSTEERPAEAQPEREAQTDASELLVARRIAAGAPIVTLLAAGVVGATVALGPALLVLAGGALFGTIAFFWASLRTLGGEAPLAEGFERMSSRRVESPDGAAERKRTALRALKDLELEHSIGKIDDGDFAELSSRYREEAKAILREMDRDISPMRARAEELAQSYLAKRGALTVAPPLPATTEDSESAPAVAPEPKARAQRQACPSCNVSNESDAEFCKACGARLAPRACPACAVVNEPDAAFCKKCGKTLNAPREEKTDASA
jgi:hypothetical protein